VTGTGCTDKRLLFSGMYIRAGVNEKLNSVHITAFGRALEQSWYRRVFGSRVLLS
jgi:hypothetical protein